MVHDSGFEVAPLQLAKTVYTPLQLSKLPTAALSQGPQQLTSGVQVMFPLTVHELNGECPAQVIDSVRAPIPAAVCGKVLPTNVQRQSGVCARSSASGPVLSLCAAKPLNNTMSDATIAS